MLFQKRKVYYGRLVFEIYYYFLHYDAEISNIFQILTEVGLVMAEIIG